MKLQLSESSVLSQLLAVIDSSRRRSGDDDAMACVKNASDLINTILTGGTCMACEDHVNVPTMSTSVYHSMVNKC